MLQLRPRGRSPKPKRRLSREEKEVNMAQRKVKAEFFLRIKRLGNANTNEFYAARKQVIAEILGHLGLEMEVFDSQVGEKDYLTDEVLLSMPIFWYKMHHWKPSHIMFLYDCLNIKREHLSQDIKKCYSRRSRSRSQKRKKNKHTSDALLMPKNRQYLQTQRKSIREIHRKSASNSWLYNQKANCDEKFCDEIWKRFVHSREDADTCVEVNNAQWNIALNDNQIVVDPDLSHALYVTLLDVHEMQDDDDSPISPLSASLGSSPILITPPTQQETMSESERQKVNRKRAKKTPITPEHFRSMMVKIRKTYKRNPKLAWAKAKIILQLDITERNIVLFEKIFECLKDKTGVDIMNTYLTCKLSEKDLNNTETILQYLSSRKSDWRQRLEILTYVEARLDRENRFNELIGDDNFVNFAQGWTAQMLDDRSQLSCTAVRLFPSVVSAVISRKGSAADFFDDNELLDNVFAGIFTVLRGRRAAQFSQIARDAAVRVLDILANVAKNGDSLEKEARLRRKSLFKRRQSQKIRALSRKFESPPPSPEPASVKSPRAFETTKAYMMLFDLLESHCSYSAEKHEAVRAACQLLAGYLVYGIDPSSTDTLRMNKEPIRRPLFATEMFGMRMSKILNAGVNDRSQLVRSEALKLLHTLSATFSSEEMEEYLDSETLFKFQKWVSRQNCAKRKHKHGRRPGARIRRTKSFRKVKFNKKMAVHHKRQTTLAFTEEQ